MQTEELLAYLFDEKPQLLTEPMAAWLGSSRRFVAFVYTFREKIRKKLRTAPERESLLDLQLELETAYLLLQERRLSLVYEPQKSGMVRCPDFAVTFTSSFTFMLEVTRTRVDRRNKAAEAREYALSTPPPNTIPTVSPVGDRLVDTICSKLSQLMTHQSNVLIIGLDAMRVTPSDLRAAIFRIERRAEQNDTMLLEGYGFRDRSDFFRHYQRLSEVLVRGIHSQLSEPLVTWINPQAKHPLLSKVRTALYHSQAI